MADIGLTALILVIANIAFSYKGFNNSLFFERYKFQVDDILVRRQYKRLVTSGFLHVSWVHLVFNMFSLLMFSNLLESWLGPLPFLVVYFSGLLGGGLLCLFIHRNHGDYSAVGASGAVCGIIFAAIALFPGMDIGFFGIPLPIPGWLYGLAYVLYSIYGIRSGKDNIGHEAHLGGALVGMAAALLLQPSAFAQNYFVILIISLPAIVFIYIIITKPGALLVDNLFYKNHKNYYSIDHKYNEERTRNQKEIDRILDKISAGGISSLTKAEKEMLDAYSKSVR
ncbi:rhomboid family intramembrane serine protease [Foetidibacter luteolus]|uniref:rhomboid family intramembrane serine protease n=1 Tax=Foetidibacter luteolus TaxID=2608880 RepID=UPI00129A6B1C|nr:rhomboid family intramembrane serine protease [Foetidibacter luteolus]